MVPVRQGCPTRSGREDSRQAGRLRCTPQLVDARLESVRITRVCYEDHSTDQGWQKAMHLLHVKPGSDIHLTSSLENDERLNNKLGSNLEANQKIDYLSIQDQGDLTKLHVQINSTGGSSKNLEAELEKRPLVCGIADLLRAKLNSQGNESFTFGLDQTDSKHSISNNEGTSHCGLNEADKEKDVNQMFNMRDSRPMQRLGSGYNSPSRSTGIKVANKLQRWGSSQISIEMNKPLTMQISDRKDEDVSEEMDDSKEYTPPKTNLKKQISARTHRKSRWKFDEDSVPKSPSTFKQRYLESKQLTKSKTDEFDSEHLATFNPKLESSTIQTVSFKNFLLARIIKSKLALTQYCELRDPPATKNYDNPKSPPLTKLPKVMLPPTPDKSTSNRSYRRSPKYAGISIDVDAAERRKPIADAYALFRIKANSHDLQDRDRPPMPRLTAIDSEKLRLLAKLNDPVRQKMKDCNGRVTSKHINMALAEKTKQLKDSEGKSDPSDEKSMFSEFSELKRSHATAGIHSTSRSAVVGSKHSPRHKQRSSDAKKTLREVLELNEVSDSRDASSSPKRQANMISDLKITRKSILFAGLFVVLIIEAILLMMLSDE